MVSPRAGEDARNRETDLVVLGRLLGELEGAFETVGQEEATKVVGLGARNEVLDLRLVEVGRREGLGGAELRAERTAKREAESAQVRLSHSEWIGKLTGRGQ